MRPMKSLLSFCLLSATAVAAPQQYSVELNLSNNSDNAVIESVGSQYRLRSLNGTFASQVFDAPTGELVINGLGGDDTINVGAINLTDAFVFVRGGAGNDSTTFDGLGTTGKVFSDDSDGDNSLTLNNSSAGGVEVYDGAGIQTLTIAVSETFGDVIMVSPDGGSSLTIDSSTIAGAVLIDNAGFGNDNLSFGNSQTGGDFFASTGNGEVFFYGAAGNIDGSLSVATNGGILDVVTDNFGMSGSLFTFSGEGETRRMLSNTVVAGILNSDSFLGFDTTILNNFEAAEVVTNNGEGGSLMEITGTVNIANRLVVTDNDFGGDAEEVDIDASGFIGDISVYSSTGASRLDVGGFMTVRNIVNTAGGGTTVRANNALIQGNLISYVFGGGSEHSLTNTAVGGLTDVFTLAGSDFVFLVDSTFNGNAYFNLGNGDDTYSEARTVFFSDRIANGGGDGDYYEDLGLNAVFGYGSIEDFEFVFLLPLTF